MTAVCFGSRTVGPGFRRDDGLMRSEWDLI
jgi:hypothetical protein